MSDLIKTLHKKGDSSTNIYPNIKRDNIPSHAINNDKLDANAVGTNNINDLAVTTPKLMAECVTTPKIGDSAVTSAKIGNGAISSVKIEDSAVTTDKINNLAVTSAKINNYAVTSDKIGEGAVTLPKLDDDIINTILRLQYCYNLYIGDSDDKIFTFYRSTTLSNRINDYSAEEIDDALDFDKASSSDYTTTDLEIIKMIIDGFNEDINSNYMNGINFNNYVFQMIHISGYYEISVYENGVIIFQLKFDETTLNIINYVNTKYVYIELSRLINPNVTYE